MGGSRARQVGGHRNRQCARLCDRHPGDQQHSENWGTSTIAPNYPKDDLDRGDRNSFWNRVDRKVEKQGYNPKIHERVIFGKEMPPARAHGAGNGIFFAQFQTRAHKNKGDFWDDSHSRVMRTLFLNETR